MVGALVDLQLAEQLPAEGVVGQHPLDGLLDDALGKAGLEMLEGFGLHAAGTAGVAPVDLLRGLVAADADLVGIDDHHEITGVEVGREGGLVLAAQHLGHFAGETAEGLIRGVDQIPLAIDANRWRVELSCSSRRRAGLGRAHRWRMGRDSGILDTTASSDLPMQGYRGRQGIVDGVTPGPPRGSLAKGSLGGSRDSSRNRG